MTRTPRTHFRQLVQVVQGQQLPFLAAAIAYYAFLSVVPLLIVGFTAATALGRRGLVESVLEELDRFLTPEGAVLVEEALVGTTGRGGFTIAGVIVLLWGALRIFRGLDIAFSRVYGVDQVKPIPEQLRDAVLVLLAIALAIAALSIAVVLLALSPIPFASIVGPMGLVIVLPLVLFPLFYVFPAKDVTITEAAPGTFFAAGGWALLAIGYGIYTAQAGMYQLYGVLGGVLLLLIWFYFAGLVLLVGVALNAVLAGRAVRDTGAKSRRDRQVQHGGTRRPTQRATMSEADGPSDAPEGESPTDHEAADSGLEDEFQEDVVTQADIDELQARLERFEAEIEDRTVHREELERDLKQYVRNRVRRGHAAGWGPYLVLLYGTAMTLGAFYFLDGGWAVAAMLVIWLSTLGLYTLMVLVGVTFTALGLPGRVLDRLRSLR